MIWVQKDHENFDKRLGFIGNRNKGKLLNLMGKVKVDRDYREAEYTKIGPMVKE
jgi:hypothetical protein